jgi:hypothetical protein
MKVDYKNLVGIKQVVRLAEEVFPAKRLELRVDMEMHQLRFVVLRWSQDGKLLSEKIYDVLHFAVDDFNGELK